MAKLACCRKRRGLEPDNFETKLRLGEAYSCRGEVAAAQPLLCAALKKKRFQAARNSTAFVSDSRRPRARAVIVQSYARGWRCV